MTEMAIEGGAARARSVDLAQHPLAILGAVGALLVLNLADLATTGTVLRAGGLEANPVSAWLMAHGALMLAKIAVVSVVGVLAVRLVDRRRAAMGLWVTVGIYLTVVLHNVVQLALT
ncbi:MAG: DUF5658 family protein [Acidimicrobiales bacterium]